jgi:hypothetical protein
VIEAAGGRGSAYENRREADRIVVVASRPLRDNSFKPYVYTAATFLPASPPRIAPIEKPAPRARSNAGSGAERRARASVSRSSGQRAAAATAVGAASPAATGAIFVPMN